MLHVPNLSCNLLSIIKFTSDHQCRANFYSSYSEFQKLTLGRMIGNAKEKDGLYYFDDGPDLSRQFQSNYPYQGDRTSILPRFGKLLQKIHQGLF